MALDPFLNEIQRFFSNAISFTKLFFGLKQQLFTHFRRSAFDHSSVLFHFKQTFSQSSSDIK